MSRPAMTTKIQFSTVGLFLILVACRPGQVSTDEDTVPDLPADDLPPPCEVPLIECGGECIDPMTSDEHCGFCDNGCGGFENGPGATGGCSEGLCLAGWSGCQGASLPVTCDDICAAHSHVGFVCVENGCGVDGGTILWTAYWWVDDGGFEGGHGEEGCTLAQAENPLMVQQVGCDVPIANAFAATGIVEQQDYRYLAQCCCDDPEE
jgi:hypothetical protein